MESHPWRVVALLEAAFPEGHDEGDHRALVSVLCEGMSERNAAHTASVYLGIHEMDAPWPAAEASSQVTNRAQRSRISELRNRISAHGWAPEED
ncbi:hypothetical protein ACWGJT_32365 [Streptomyces xantholiticus]